MGVFPDFSSTEIIMSFLTLTFLEIVLGVDNIIFISITSSRLAEEDKKKATNLGLLAAMWRAAWPRGDIPLRRYARSRP